MTTFVAPFLKVALVAGAIALVTRQCRKPLWLPGRLFLWVMNRSHRSVTAWGLEHATIANNATILDVGCGGGRTIDTMAAMASAGAVYGIDYSSESVAVARRTNAAGIQAGRVDIRQGTVSDLPFSESMFDVVTAIETFYYWPEPMADLREVLRVLKPAGQVLVVAETYRGSKFDFLFRPAMKLLRATYLTADEHKAFADLGGFFRGRGLRTAREGLALYCWQEARLQQSPAVTPSIHRAAPRTASSATLARLESSSPRR